MRKEKIIQNIKSNESKFCEGFISSKHARYYLLGLNCSVAKTKKSLGHPGSVNLDAINAFDLAEVDGAHIGQINMIVVSSFCGPNGLIWGYDLCQAPKKLNKWGITTKEINEYPLQILDMDPLINAFSRLTGSVQEARFPFLPGSIVPCAVKKAIKEGESIIYAAQACGIPVDRNRNACLLMEDYGSIPLDTANKEAYIRKIVLNLVKSIFVIGKNQNVEYQEILLGFKDITVNEGEIGCALVADPYFILANDAIPKDKKLQNISIDEWEKSVSHKFLYKSSNSDINLTDLSFNTTKKINKTYSRL